MIQVVGSLSASRAFWPRRRCRRPSQAGSDHNCTDVSEARTSLLLLLYAEQGRKVDLALIFRIPQTGVSPDSSRPGLVSGQLGRPRGSLLPEAVLAGVGRRQSTEFRYSSHLEGPLPETRQHDISFQRAGRSPSRAYSASTEE